MSAQSNRAEILCAVPELFGTGGIQLVCRQIARTLNALARENGVSLRLLSLNDLPRSSTGADVEGIEYEGFERRKAPFVWRALQGNPRFVLAAHPNLGPVAWLAARRSGCPYVVFAYGVEVARPLALHRRWTLQQASKVVAVSSSTADVLFKVQGYNKERVAVLNCGVGADRLSIQPGVLPTELAGIAFILTVGRQDSRERYKGTDHLIRALPQLAESHLAIVGTGDDLPRLRDLAKACGISSRVHFLEGLQDPDLAACYRAATAFAMPSAGEGFGLVYLEAMAAGLPVLGAAQGGTLDIIEHRQNGILVPYGDIQGLASALSELLGNETLRKTLGANARQTVQQRFLERHFMTGLRSLIESLCGW